MFAIPLVARAGRVSSTNKEVRFLRNQSKWIWSLAIIFSALLPFAQAGDCKENCTTICRPVCEVIVEEVCTELGGTEEDCKTIAKTVCEWVCEQTCSWICS